MTTTATGTPAEDITDAERAALDELRYTPCVIPKGFADKVAGIIAPAAWPANDTFVIRTTDDLEQAFETLRSLLKNPTYREGAVRGCLTLDMSDLSIFGDDTAEDTLRALLAIR